MLAGGGGMRDVMPTDPMVYTATSHPTLAGCHVYSLGKTRGTVLSLTGIAVRKQVSFQDLQGK